MTKQTPDRIDEIFLQYHAELKHGLGELAGHGTAKEQAKAQLQAHMDKVVGEIIKSINGIKLEHTKQDNFGSTSKADLENRSLEKHKKLIISNLRQRYKDMKEKG